MQANIFNYNGKIIHTFEGNSKKRIFNKIREAGIKVPYDGYIRIDSGETREYFKMQLSGKIVPERNWKYEDQ